MRTVAQDFELGSHRGLVWTAPGRFLVAYLVTLPACVGLFLLVLGASITVKEQREQGGWYYGLPALIVAVGAFALAWHVFVLLSGRQTRVWVGHFQHGIVREVAGRVPEPYSWDEIVGIHRFTTKEKKWVTSFTAHALHVVSEEGTEIVVNHAFEGGVTRFVAEVDQAFTRTRLPRDRSRLTAGERIDFLAVRLDSAGIGHDRGRLGWHEVDRIAVSNGRLRIHRRGARQPWVDIPMQFVRNASVLMALAAGMGGETTGS
ncbi:DUF6585 family protein [Embleya sp. NPDC055664]